MNKHSKPPKSNCAKLRWPGPVCGLSAEPGWLRDEIHRDPTVGTGFLLEQDNAWLHVPPVQPSPNLKTIEINQTNHLWDIMHRCTWQSKTTAAQWRPHPGLWGEHQETIHWLIRSMPRNWWEYKQAGGGNKYLMQFGQGWDFTTVYGFMLLVHTDRYVIPSTMCIVCMFFFKQIQCMI